MWQLLKDTVNEWLEDRAAMHGADPRIRSSADDAEPQCPPKALSQSCHAHSLKNPIAGTLRQLPVTRMRNDVENFAPGLTRRKPRPLTSALVGAVIGSSAMNGLSLGA